MECCCILGEILGRRVLFRGKDYLHQLQQLIQILGTPRETDMYFVRNQDCKRVIQSWGRQKRRPWSSIYPTAEPQALDLLVSEVKLFTMFFFFFFFFFFFQWV